MPEFVDGEYQDGELRGLTFLAGERGMGKTTEAIRLVEQCGGPVIFFDTVNKHRHLLPRFTPFMQPGRLQEYLRINRGRRVQAIYVPLPPPGVRPIFEPKKKSDPRQEWLVQHLICVCLMARAFGNMIICIDEIDMFCGPEWGHRWMPDELYDIAHFGRHFKVSALATARDPKSLSKKFRSQCATMRLFRCSEQDDVDYFAKRIGAANAAKLPTLQKTYFLLWTAGDQAAPICGGPRNLRSKQIA
jgi:hypothetical protein